MSEQIAKIREKSTLGRPWVDLLTPWGAMSLPKSIKLEPGGVLGHLERLWAARLAPGAKSQFGVPRLFASSWPKMGVQGSILDPWRCTGGSKISLFDQKSA